MPKCIETNFQALGSYVLLLDYIVAVLVRRNHHPVEMVIPLSRISILVCVFGPPYVQIFTDFVKSERV